MASNPLKRRPESDHSAEPYALCSSCSRCSNNVKSCEHCGTALLEEDVVRTVSTDPKRPRLESSSSPTNGVNGDSATEGGSPASSSSSPPPISSTVAATAKGDTATKTANGNTSPITASTSSAAEPVRPQALFANTNNIANNSAASLAVSTSSSVDLSANSIPANLTVNAGNKEPAPPPYPGGPAAGGVTNSAAPRTGNTLPGPPPLTQTGSRPNYNVPPTAPISTPSTVPPYHQGSNPGNPSATTAPRMDPTPAPPLVTGAPAAAASSSNVPQVVINRDNVLIPAQQIRIGSQKFKPLSPVTFKDDGILFTLKDYTYAPVLLNARAIIRCKANLNFMEFPGFLLQLESSCMRQIRNIFGLKDEEFGENFSGPLEIKRCIMILPSIVNSQNTALEIQKALKQVFHNMESRYRRYNKIVEEITGEQFMDILLAPLTLQPPSAPAPTQNRPTLPPQVPRNVPQQRAIQPPPPQHQGPANMPQWHPGMQNAANRVPHPQAPQMPPQAGGGGMMQPDATLTIPNDPVRWAAMQRSLQVGGVYHVMMINGQKKYCLWNGSQLVPCYVQNTEVQLECRQVRIGSLRAQCVGALRIKLDNTSGIFFTVQAQNISSKQVHISTDDVLNAYACFESMGRLFIDLKWSGGDRLRKTLKMQAQKDPTYDPNAASEHRKHLVFTLNNVNQDQKDALMQMRLPGQQKTFFESLPIMKALKILSDIQAKSSVQQTLERYMKGNEPVPNRMKLAQLANQVEQELIRDENVRVQPDDDDDDLIMMDTEIGIKCPYTQQVMKEPIRNKVCGHNYEKSAIQEFMNRKKGTAKCPYAGCGNRNPLKAEDMEDNPELRKYIKENHS